uniref:Reverse transcriptase domain-containing protein n=1 Tax=Tanacetum cinerariifolium TaxID=118510 RepID=A0A6L2K8Z0_TANCI|nr:hypothetical protein [Tanacetum cinerariifolium]
MTKLLRAPTEGYAEEIVVLPILAEHFELKHSLIDMMTSDQFFGLEKDNPHDHIRFTELHQLDTFYNALNPPDQDSLNSAASGNLLEGPKLTHVVNHQTSVVTTAMTAILKQFQATPPPASIKAVEEICVTCDGAHPYYQCLAADGNTYLKFRNNIQGYFSAAAVNYNQGNFGYRPPSVANQIRPPAITTQSGLVLDEPSAPMPLPFINPKEDERVEETLTDPDLAEYTIKVLSPLVQKVKPHSQRNYVVHQRDPHHPHIPYPSRMNQVKQQEKDEIQVHKRCLKLSFLIRTLNENCSAVILKKLPEKLGDPGKFLIPYGFSELKCKALADLANRVICTPAGIARDVFVPVGKFTFPVDFVIVDYKSDPRVPPILGRPFLQTARALIDVYREEMILHDGDERLTLNMRHDTSSYSNHTHKESINMINIYDDSYDDYLEYLFATNHLSGNPTFSSHFNLTSPEVKDDIFDPEGDIVLIEKLLNLDSTKDLPPPHNINPLSSSTTSSSLDHLLEEFVDELTLITFPPGNDDLPFDIEFDLREIEYLLNHDPTKEMDSILEDSKDECNLVDPNNDLFDTIPDMLTDEHTLDYSSPPLYDDVDDDLVELESGILIHENLYEDTIRVTPDKNVKKISISNAFLILEDFNPPLYKIPFHKEVHGSKTLLLFSSENKEKVFKPRILTSKGVHTSLLLKLSHRGDKAYKVIKTFESPMEIFPCSYGEDIRILDVLCLHFYPP